MSGKEVESVKRFGSPIMLRELAAVWLLLSGTLSAEPPTVAFDQGPKIPTLEDLRGSDLQLPTTPLDTRPANVRTFDSGFAAGLRAAAAALTAGPRHAGGVETWKHQIQLRFGLAKDMADALASVAVAAKNPLLAYLIKELARDLQSFAQTQYQGSDWQRHADEHDGVLGRFAERMLRLGERAEGTAEVEAGSRAYDRGVVSALQVAKGALRQVAGSCSQPECWSHHFQMRRNMALAIAAALTGLGPTLDDGGIELQVEGLVLELQASPQANSGNPRGWDRQIAEQDAAFSRVADRIARLVAAPGLPSPVPLVKPEAVVLPPPGAYTLKALKSFTVQGPGPEERGDAYLYAQGAKILPAHLKPGSTSNRAKLDPGFGLPPTLRGVLYRYNGRAFVRPEGDFPTKALAVPEELARGIVSDTVVQLNVSKNEMKLSRLGSYPQDMAVGRVSRDRKGNLVLKPLLGQEHSLYGEIPIALGAKVPEGRILQAYVRSEGGEFEAAPLLDLGTEITPEVAARDISLRHGARGYMDVKVIEQGENTGRANDPQRDFEKLAAGPRGDARNRRVQDLRSKPFVTIDPPGAGDLDDAFYIERKAGGGYTWYLATADIARYAPPGSPAFRAAARIGNTFYSLDTHYPMNHPVISKQVASLLAGKDSMALITRMEFDPEGRLMEDSSEVFLGIVRVQGRYSYDQVVEYWEGRGTLAHAGQVDLTRELAAKLTRKDAAAGKLDFNFRESQYRRSPDGTWTLETEHEDSLTKESHRLIEELKVYGNRVLAQRLTRITRDFNVPHISRVHQPAHQGRNADARRSMAELGAPWKEGQDLSQYLREVRSRTDLTPEAKEALQILALRTRTKAQYDVVDEVGHEGLALAPGAYDHTSAGIRRFADMYNLALLTSYLEGGDPREAYRKALSDIQSLGFKDLGEYMSHLNGRERAHKGMERELADFMSLYELSKEENRGRPLRGFVKIASRDSLAVVQLNDPPVSLALRGDQAAGLSLLDEVEITVRGVDLGQFKSDLKIRKLAGAEK